MNQPPIKRRRFSFSLRTLMVFMLVVCLLFGFIGLRLQRAREQQAFLRELVEAGWSHLGTPEFWELVIDNNYIDSIESVSNFSNDVEKKLDVALLMDLKNLKVLHLHDAKMSDLSPLADLKNLEELYIEDTQVGDLSPLAELKNLERLDLNGTQVSDLSPLAKLKNLEGLMLNNTQVSDLSPLAGLEKLSIFYLNNTQIADLTPLAGLKNLRYLEIRNTQVTDEQIQQLQKALPNCIIEH